MTMERIRKRFTELRNLAADVDESTEKVEFRKPHWYNEGEYSFSEELRVNEGLYIEWTTSATALLHRVFGPDDPTTIAFAKALMPCGGTLHRCFSNAFPVFQSAYDQFENGHLFDLRNLVHAEVFSDELDLAKHYLDNDGKTAAAVVAGVVLETALRKLCVDRDLEVGQLNPMNQRLRENGAYTQIVWRQIQAWADIRNSAAHGKPDEFEAQQVSLMISGVRDFVAKHLNE